MNELGSDILKSFSGEGDVVVCLKKVRLVARFQYVDDITSLLPLYLEGDAVALYMEMKEEDQNDISLIEARLKAAFTDGAFTAYRKLTMVRWAGECVNVCFNKIRQLAGLAGFKGAGLERFTKLAFVTGFPNAISIELQQALKIKTLAMWDLLVRARVLTTGDQSQDMVTAVSSTRGGIAPAAKSGSISSVICHRCNSKGHIAKDCRKSWTRCFQCGEMGHCARDCSGNKTGDKASAPAFSPMKMWIWRSQQRASMLMGQSVQH